MDRQHFLCLYRLDSSDRYLLWFDGEPDGCATNSAGKVLSFSSQAAALEFAAASALTVVQEQPILHNFDLVEKWVRNRRLKTIDSESFLACWNLLADISVSVGGSFDFDKDRTGKIYGKLFYGNNLPAITPPGHCYIPIWSCEERAIIREVLGAGLSLFREVVNDYRNSNDI